VLLLLLLLLQMRLLEWFSAQQWPFCYTQAAEKAAADENCSNTAAHKRICWH
jgi:hypothetical protein